MAENTPQEAPLLQAFQNLASGLADLLVNLLELAKHEAQADAIEIGKDAAAVGLALVVFVLGYLGLLVSAVLFAAWYAGIFGAGIACFALTLAHLGVGGITLAGLQRHLKQKYYGLRYTNAEIKRTKEWAREMPKQL